MSEEKPKTLEERARELDRKLLDKMGESVVVPTRKLAYLDESKIRCPLCHGKFEKRYDQKRQCAVLVCHVDKIAIRCDDPFVGKWEGALRGDRIECPGCGSDMRFFCTSAPYFKAKCYSKGCGATLASVAADKQLGVTVIPGGKEGSNPVVEKRND